MENTTAQVVLVRDINPGISYDGFVNSSFADGLTEFNEQLFFTADDGETGNELWISDGTTEGTQLLVDINLGMDNYGFYSGSDASGFTEFNEQLFFSASDEETGNELWISDGTTEGTQLLVDIDPGISNYSGTGYGYSNSSYALGFTEFNEKLFFTADDGEIGNELWVSDGTTEGTQLLLDINPGTGDYGYENGSYASDFTEFNGQLFFSASDEENGRELWVSDGTAEGTQLLLDINPGVSDYGYVNSSNASDFTEFNGQLFFSANDGENGNELWVSDGTAEGTQLLVDINPGTGTGYENGSYASDFTEFNGQLFFTARDDENGNELWVTDGTTEGTQLLLDINPGTSIYSGYPASSYAYGFTEFDGKLYFSANDGETGNERWVTDGTTEGTQLLVDINPGISDFYYATNSYVSNLTVFDDQLFFTADNGQTGRELFKLSFDDLGTNIIGTDNADNLTGSDANEEIDGLKANDTLSGSGGNDSLDGGKGKDSLSGGRGNDFLTGGKGKDIFEIASISGEDTITDFELGRDLIGLSADLSYDDLAFSGSSISNGDELLATLTGVNTEYLTSNDFV